MTAKHNKFNHTSQNNSIESRSHKSPKENNKTRKITNKSNKTYNSYNRYNKNKTTKLSIYHEITSIHQLSKIAMVFWIGGSCMAGIVFFPLIFKLIDQVAASQLVGQMLHILAYIGIVCLFIALVEVMLNHRLALFKTRRFWYILIMNLFLIIDYFAILPSIYTIRQKIASMAHSIISVQNNVFDFWHSLSAIMFFIICIFGILYLLEM